MDVRTADGSVVKISAGNEQDLAKTLGVEMVQNMYKVHTMLLKNFLLVKTVNFNFLLPNKPKTSSNWKWNNLYKSMFINTRYIIITLKSIFIKI